MVHSLAAFDQLEREKRLEAYEAAADAKAYEEAERLGILSDRLPPPGEWVRFRQLVDELQKFDRLPSLEELAQLQELTERTRERLTPPEARTSPIDRLWLPVPTEWATTPPPARKWLLRHPTRDGNVCGPGQGDGLLPLGKCGVINAEGGGGKTQLMIQLAVAVVLGRKFLEHFEVGEDARGRRVAMLLAEEEAEECQRRYFECVRGLGLTDDEMELVRSRLTFVPLAGVQVPLMTREGEETPMCQAIRRKLAEEAGDIGFALVVLDPLARFAGVDTESDNASATRFVSVVETFAQVAGGPTVLLTHHSSKMARRTGTVDGRGVSGITDGLRWAGSLRLDQNAEAHFRQVKSNYSRPMPESEEIHLVRERGRLRVLTEAEQNHRRDLEEERAEAANEARERRKAERQQRELDRNVELVVDAVRRTGSTGLPSMDAIARAAMVPIQKGRQAVTAAIADQLLIRTGPKTRTRIVSAEYHHEGASDD